MDIDPREEKSFFGSVTAVSEEQKIQKQRYENPSKEIAQPQKEIDFETDDYSINSNFEEETNYNARNKTKILREETQESQAIFKPLDVKKVEQNQKEVVNLIKKKQKFHFGGRLKIALSSFIVIMILLIFATVWNFSSLARMNTNLAEKEITINELQTSIRGLLDEYNFLESDENLTELAKEAGFVEPTDENTVTISIDDMYNQVEVEDIPSNWFNNVCNFLTKIFN